MKIKLSHLTKAFPGRAKGSLPVIAVNDFDYEIPDGSLVGLLGPSGCGKSTTLNLISGLLAPTSGEIYFGEENVTGLPPEKRGIGLVFQNYALYPHLTVLENILFPLQNLKGKEKLSKEEMNARALQVARLVEIEPLISRRPAELSGGQQQRVAIARALVKMPKVLLLDEPLSNLDARLRLQTREELKRIQQSTGITTVFVTHDQDEAMSISDEIVVMNNGIVQQIGRPQQVYDDPANVFVAKFLGIPPINLFDGEIRSRSLFLGADKVMEVPGVEDRKVCAAIRPEAFIPGDNGPLVCRRNRVEVLGRDVSVVFSHPACTSSTPRAILSSDSRSDPGSDEIRFSLKEKKVYLFDPDTGERIYSDKENNAGGKQE